MGSEGEEGSRVRVRAMVVAMLCVLGVVSLGLVACDPPPKRVLVIGDSLTVGAIKQGLGADHPWRWTFSAEVGRSTNTGIAIAKERDIGAYDLVIIALGTNDYLDTTATYRARIDKMMSALSRAPKVIWVNVDTVTAHMAPAALGVNPAIAAAPARHPKLTVANWDAYVRTVPNMSTLRAADQIHYTAAGYALRARWMERLVPA